jgi:NADPH:quinone reductase-like Zn-dependent oxidoreductase
MRRSRRKVCLGLLLTAITATGFAQKVKVGYDKSVDFSKYKTYTWVKPAMPPTRPLLYETVVSTVDGELHSKGLTRTEKNGDLTLIGAGGIDFAIAVSSGTPLSPTFTGPSPTMNANVWSGAEGSGVLMPAVPDGTLELQFVDQSTNQVIWSGSVSQKLDIEHKQKSLDLATKAVVKLLKKFPPGSSK